jgi:hypothetical protein
MVNNVFKKSLAVLIIILFFGTCTIPSSFSQMIEKNYKPSKMLSKGQILYSPMWNTNTYLRESDGTLNHTWYSPYLPGVSVWWLGDGQGTIIRTIRTGVGPGTGGTGGGVQKVTWDGDVVWDFRYNTNGVMSHHDVKTLPNGNVLLIAWETKTKAEAIQAGRNPNTVSNEGLWPDHIIEVKPTGQTTGDIVWEWHSWNHLIQDYDSSKDNYGVIADHPELIDINYAPAQGADIMHTNSIDYNEDFDQILLSVNFYSEIWVIDHSTTTEEAAGHIGGNYGKGGDLLYRWGNPRTYDIGTSSDEKFFGQHDATWIKKGYPGDGDILVFNNGENRHYSSADEIIPPVDEDGNYYLEEGQAYGPEEQTWIYTANPPNSLYSNTVGGAHRLPNGNTLITDGESGKFIEVTMEKEIVWTFNAGGGLFKVCYIAPEELQPPVPKPDLDCSGSLSWIDIKPGSTVYGSFKVQNIGDPGTLLNWTINTSFISWGTWTFNPESGQGLKPEDEQVNVSLSVVAPNAKKSEFDGYFRVENQDDPEDFGVIPVYLKTFRQRTTNLPFFDFFESHLKLLPIIQKLLNRL